MRIFQGLCLLGAAALLASCTTTVAVPRLAAAVAIPGPVLVERAPIPGPPQVAAAQVAPAPVAPAPGPGLAGLRPALERYLTAQEGTYGVYILDLTTGQSLGINADRAFPAASTFKLPMALYLLDQAEQGKLNLNETIAYQESDWEEGTGTLQDSIQPGQRVQVRELIRLAITQSDNIATQMLMRRYGFQNVYAFMQRLGGKVTHFAPGVPGTTPREMALYLKQLPTVLQDASLRQFLMTALEQTAFTDRTAAGVPAGVKVAHKIGTLPGVINDVALVEAPGHPLLIAVFSEGVDDAAAPGIITTITRLTYQQVIGR